MVAVANLAHALLFQGKYDKALTLYRQHWIDPDKAINGLTFREAVIKDFVELAEKNIIHSDPPKVKRALDIIE